MKNYKRLNALEERRKSFDNIPVQQREGMHRPGSQNPKKGYNAKQRVR